MDKLGEETGLDDTSTESFKRTALPTRFPSSFPTTSVPTRSPSIIGLIVDVQIRRTATSVSVRSISRDCVLFGLRSSPTKKLRV